MYIACTHQRGKLYLLEITHNVRNLHSPREHYLFLSFSIRLSASVTFNVRYLSFDRKVSIKEFKELYYATLGSSSLETIG